MTLNRLLYVAAVFIGLGNEVGKYIIRRLSILQEHPNKQEQLSYSCYYMTAHSVCNAGLVMLATNFVLAQGIDWHAVP